MHIAVGPEGASAALAHQIGTGTALVEGSTKNDRLVRNAGNMYEVRSSNRMTCRVVLFRGGLRDPLQAPRNIP